MARRLQDRQKQLSRDAILEALAARAAERGLLDFTIAEIAERAGVSQRTVYNHFATRQELLDALSDWVTARMEERGGQVYPAGLDSLVDAVRRNFALFGRMPELSHALVVAQVVEPTSGQHRRTVAFLDVVARAHPEMDERDRVAVAAILRRLVSSASWDGLTREHGLSSEEAAAAVGWAVRQLTAALARGEAPELHAGDEGEER